MNRRTLLSSIAGFVSALLVRPKTTVASDKVQMKIIRIQNSVIVPIKWIETENEVIIDEHITQDGKSKKWYKNGLLHREDGPAIEWADGDKAWYKNGLFQRLEEMILIY